MKHNKFKQSCLYRKVKNPEDRRARYEPVGDYDSEFDYYRPFGTHLLVVSKGAMRARYNVDPALAPFVAAALILEPSMTDIVYNASKMTPNEEMITKEQKAAWEALEESFGGKVVSLRGPSYAEIAGRIGSAIQDKAVALMNNPVIKDAYDEFVLLCKLAEEKKDES